MSPIEPRPHRLFTKNAWLRTATKGVDPPTIKAGLFAVLRVIHPHTPRTCLDPSQSYSLMAIACQRTTKSYSAGMTPIDIVTYRFNGELMYVPLAPDYNVSPALRTPNHNDQPEIQQALSHARDAFPQLKELRDASLSLSLTAPTQGQKYVGITALAWPKLITHIPRYQIIDVHITPTCDRVGPIPDITITSADAPDAADTEPAPPYRRSDDSDDEKTSESCTRPASPSQTLHPRRSWFFSKRNGQ